MKTSTAQHVLLDVAEPETTVPTVSPPPTAADRGDVLPPPSKTQVFYWTQLCGDLHRRGTAGIAEAEERPVDLVLSRTTLKALRERGLVARRDRAWKLRRGWYERSPRSRRAR